VVEKKKCVKYIYIYLYLFTYIHIYIHTYIHIVCTPQHKANLKKENRFCDFKKAAKNMQLTIVVEGKWYLPVSIPSLFAKMKRLYIYMFTVYIHPPISSRTFFWVSTPAPHLSYHIPISLRSVKYLYIYMFTVSAYHCSSHTKKLAIDHRSSKWYVSASFPSDFERWGAGVETQKNVRGEIGGWGRVPFHEPYAPLLSTIYDGA